MPLDNIKTTRHPELLVPAGSPDVLRTAVRYGADAVYLGGEAFSLRAGAANFSPDEMREAVRYAHERGVKVHVAANIFAHNEDLREAEVYFDELNEIGPDAILVADPGMFAVAKRHCPGVELHISTQANTTNYESCLFWHGLGAKRIVLAREVSCEEMRGIRSHVPDDLELETFVHGAMCISYSGRCLLSNYFTGRDANRGACSHPCRWQYALMEMTRPGEYLPVEETERGTFLYNSKDMCLIGHLPELYGAGIDSFKIEGRMKTALYVATVTRAYRRAMDDFEADPALYEANKESYLKEVSEGTTRDFTTGFFFGRPDDSAQIYRPETYIKTATYLGRVESFDGGRTISLRQKNKFSVGETIEILKPRGEDVRAVVSGMRNEAGLPVTSAPHPLEKIEVELEYLTEARPETGDVIRRREE